MKTRLRFIMFVYLFNVASVNAQDPLVFIEPAHPNSGDVIRVGVKVERCNTMPFENSQNISSAIDINGFNIELNTIAYIPILVGGTPCPPPYYAYYELGVLSEGDYSLSTWIYNHQTTFPFPLNFDPPPPYDFIDFSVSVAPVSVVTNTQEGLLLAFIMLLGLGIYQVRKYSL